jgi:hypothetical protein
MDLSWKLCCDLYTAVECLHFGQKAGVETLRNEVEAWTQQRNVKRTTVNWQLFQTQA